MIDSEFFYYLKLFKDGIVLGHLLEMQKLQKYHLYDH